MWIDFLSITENTKKTNLSDIWVTCHLIVSSLVTNPSNILTFLFLSLSLTSLTFLATLPLLRTNHTTKNICLQIANPACCASLFFFVNL